MASRESPLFLVPRPGERAAMPADPDAVLEGLIRAVGEAIVTTRDQRYVDIQRRLHGMRSAAQVVRMEAARGLAQPPEVA